MLKMIAAATLLAVSATLAAQTPAPQAPSVLYSHVVHPDGTVTLRLAAPGAKSVEAYLDTLKQHLPLTNDGTGVWSVTTPALRPEIYDYGFLVDGVPTIDPHNSQVHPAFGTIESLVTVPGNPAMPWEATDVPHGNLTVHHFTTHAALNLPGNQSEYLVYTPAGYDAKKKGGYPVLYLLHGYLDDAKAWTGVGHAHFVLDNMIASGKAKPMIVVMPLGYGDWTFLLGGFGQWMKPERVSVNSDHFIDSLETEVMPAVDREYNIAKGRENHAVAGLSMGGLETLTLGMRHPEQFAYVAAMSAALHLSHFETLAPNTNPKTANYKLFWSSVGTDDHLLKANREFATWAKEQGYPLQAHETEGAHQWPVWRENLVTILPLLFR